MQTNGIFKRSRLITTGVFFALFLIITITFYAITGLSKSPEKSISKPTVERGSIVDRNGKPLAVQTSFYHFVLTPKTLPHSKIYQFADDVAPVLGLNSKSLAEKIKQNSDANFLYVQKKITENQHRELLEIIAKRNYTSVRFDKIPGRIYPENDLASQLIGYMGDAGVGLSGIEYSEQNTLSPQPDPNNPVHKYGNNIFLTIDANLQYKLEKIARETMAQTKCESLMMLACEAKSGEILSYISLPSANLNAYSSASQEEQIDRPSVSAYEPGSVFKVFSVASFIDEGTIKKDSTFYCDGVYEKTTSTGEKIKITCLGHHGTLTPEGALKYSCNDALAQMSDTIETNRFLTKIKQLGFGTITGIERGSETSGFVKTPGDKFWSARSKATISFGQEISVSALQMIQGGTTIANMGVPIQLTFISKITDKDGNIKYIHDPQYKQRVLSESTSRYIINCMEKTTLEGNGTRANVEDLSIGTKTGTAQMADPVHGGYSKTDFIASCMGIFPVQDPEIVLYVVIQKPKGETYGGRIAAPAIKKAANEIIDHMGMNRAGAASLSHTGRISVSEPKSVNVEKTVPDFIGKSKRDIIPLLSREDLNIIIQGEGWVKEQTPPPGTPVTENMTIELFLGQ